MRIYSDMDGYLANFVQGVIDLFNLSIKHEEVNGYNVIFDRVTKETGLSKTKAWNEIDNVEFWLNLNPYPWIDDVIKLMDKYDKEWIILTSIPTHHPQGMDGKAKWLKKYVPHVFRSKRIFYGQEKHLLAYPGVILIDDSPVQVKKFNENGRTILVPQPWNFASLSMLSVPATVGMLLEATNATEG